MSRPARIQPPFADGDQLGEYALGQRLLFVAKRFEDAVRMALQSAVEDLRLMIDSLDPVDGDLVTVLASLRARLTPRLNAAGIQVIWGVSDLPPLPWLGPKGVLGVMRILQEGINNVLKHAQADAIEVACGVSDKGESVWIKLVDNGVGIGNPPEPGDSGKDCPVGQWQQVVCAASGGRGLTNMKSRAAEIGARLDIVANAEHGTTVMLHLPVRTAQRRHARQAS